MTINEKIRAKIKKTKIIGFTFWLVFAIPIFLQRSDLFGLQMLAFAGFGGTVIYILYFLKCPKCDARIGQTAMQNKALNFCPERGTDFKERA